MDDLNNAFKEAVRAKAWALCQLLLTLDVEIKIDRFEVTLLSKHQPNLLKGRFNLLEKLNAEQQDLLGTPEEIIKYLITKPELNLGNILLHRCLSCPETFPYYFQLLERDLKPHIPIFNVVELDRQLQEYLTDPSTSKNSLSPNTLNHLLIHRNTANSVTDLLLQEVYGKVTPTAESVLSNQVVWKRYPKDPESLLVLTKELLSDHATNALAYGPHTAKLPELLAAIAAISNPLPLDVLDVAVSRVGYEANRNASLFLALGEEHLDLYLPTFGSITGGMSIISLLTDIKQSGTHHDSVYISKSTLPFISWIIKYSVKSRPGQKTLTSIATTLLRLWDKPGHLELQDVLDLFKILNYGSPQTKILSSSYREDQLAILGAVPTTIHLTNAIKKNDIESVTYLLGKLKAKPTFDIGKLAFLAVEFRALEVLPLLTPLLSKAQQERLETILPFLKEELTEDIENEENT